MHFEIVYIVFQAKMMFLEIKLELLMRCSKVMRARTRTKSIFLPCLMLEFCALITFCFIIEKKKEKELLLATKYLILLTIVRVHDFFSK